MGGKPVSGQEGQDGLFASAVWDKNTGEYIVKIVNTSDIPQNVTLKVNGLKKGRSVSAAGCISYHSNNPDIDNTLANPNAVVPVEGEFKLKAGALQESIPAKTFMIYRLKLD